MDKEEFISQIQKHKKEMFLLAVSIVKDYHDAEDAVSDAILKAYEKKHSLKNKERFKFWVMQILVNNALQIVRKRKRVVCVEKVDVYAMTSSNQMSDVWETVLSLEDDLRTIVILYYYQGFKVKEIANIVKLPPGTVKSRLSRAREKLKIMLK